MYLLVNVLICDKIYHNDDHALSNNSLLQIISILRLHFKNNFQSTGKNHSVKSFWGMMSKPERLIRHWFHQDFPNRVFQLMSSAANITWRCLNVLLYNENCTHPRHSYLVTYKKDTFKKKQLKNSHFGYRCLIYVVEQNVQVSSCYVYHRP